MDTQIDVQWWLADAAEAVCDVDGALSALSGDRLGDSLEVYNLANLDAPSVAEYLKNLAARLQVVATNLIHLADNADLAELAASLQIAAAPADSPGSLAGASPGLVSQEVERLLAQLEELVPPVSQAEGDA